MIYSEWSTCICLFIDGVIYWVTSRQRPTTFELWVRYLCSEMISVFKTWFLTGQFHSSFGLTYQILFAHTLSIENNYTVWESRLLHYWFIMKVLHCITNTSACLSCSYKYIWFYPFRYPLTYSLIQPLCTLRHNNGRSLSLTLWSLVCCRFVRNIFPNADSSVTDDFWKRCQWWAISPFAKMFSTVFNCHIFIYMHFTFLPRCF